ncbi:C40 family peptidase [Thermosynechococcaceae cyanobacterium BACA0444]|uniref:C40 family peptidase n=1 Tax=Pseudocalidococcus azoricus BACA0444 TaxID=2918990 RepID=A0AAE4JXD0_9CYAN|nr:C40 family peptidase [Pseudocalidococcus azoricus]MDS3862395.1 C40 family peptidase [Pseudocalidococcus azoricus BACA0444]
MVTWAELIGLPASQFYRITHPLNIYDSPALSSLATQAWAGRYLQLFNLPPEKTSYRTGHEILLWEDQYPGWLAGEDLAHLEPTPLLSPPKQLKRDEILQRIPAIIEFCHMAKTRCHTYLWGGTLGPSYDCSGLIQASFAAMGIWLPRDAYQQEGFVAPIPNPGVNPDDLVPYLESGDLVFFGTPSKATHVGLYLGGGEYLHSSGKDQGRNGIGMDSLLGQDHPNPDPISQAYYQQFRGAGRVMTSFSPNL